MNRLPPPTIPKRDSTGKTLPRIFDLHFRSYHDVPTWIVRTDPPARTPPPPLHPNLVPPLTLLLLPPANSSVYFPLLQPRRPRSGLQNIEGNIKGHVNYAECSMLNSILSRPGEQAACTRVRMSECPLQRVRKWRVGEGEGGRRLCGLDRVTSMRS